VASNAPHGTEEHQPIVVTRRAVPTARQCHHPWRHVLLTSASQPLAIPNEATLHPHDCMRRPIKAARKAFDDFPQGAQLEMIRVLTTLAEGQMTDIAKHLTSFSSGVMELPGQWCKRCWAAAMLAPEWEKLAMDKLEDLDNLFPGRHFDREVIILCVRWYLRIKLSLRDLLEMMVERGLAMAHTTIMRWVQHYTPELERRWHRHALAVGRSWRVDEIYVSRRDFRHFCAGHQTLSHDHRCAGCGPPSPARTRVKPTFTAVAKQSRHLSPCHPSPHPRQSATDDIISTRAQNL
jgi:hypothetical protein